MKNLQKRHFDNAKNQYEEDKLFNPPLHVQDELNKIIELIKDYSSSNRLVDFGSGNGRLTIPLLKSGFSVTSVDISQRSLLNLYTNAGKIKKQNRLTTKTVLPDSAKIICGTDILHHVDLNDYLPLFYQTLEKNGVLIFSEPNILNIGWTLFISIFLDWKVEKGIVQINYFNLVNKLRMAGFKEMKIIGLFLIPPTFLGRIYVLRHLNMLLGNLPILKLFAFRYIILARK